MTEYTDPVSRLWDTELYLVHPKYNTSYIPGITKVDDDGEGLRFNGRISHTTISSVNPENGMPLTHTVIKLFCSPEVPIVQGSTLYVADRGIKYSCAGIPAKYNKHQEVLLEYQKKGE